MKVLRSRQRIAAVGGEVVFVVHDPPDRVRAGILADLAIPWPVLVDLERGAYRAWGLGRARLADIWLSPALWARYARLLAGGERLRRLGRDACSSAATSWSTRTAASPTHARSTATTGHP